jgi:hypothetical protein
MSHVPESPITMTLVGWTGDTGSAVGTAEMATIGGEAATTRETAPAAVRTR